MSCSTVSCNTVSDAWALPLASLQTISTNFFRSSNVKPQDSTAAMTDIKPLAIMWLTSHLMPSSSSFSADLEKLDEEGIRWDVNHIIANGFISVMAAVESCGLTFEERKKFVEIVCSEAKGKAHASLTVLQDTVEQDIEMLKHAEKVGCTFATVGHPVQYYPRSIEDIYAEYKYVCNSTDL